MKNQILTTLALLAACMLCGCASTKPSSDMPAARDKTLQPLSLITTKGDYVFVSQMAAELKGDKTPIVSCIVNVDNTKEMIELSYYVGTFVPNIKGDVLFEAFSEPMQTDKMGELCHEIAKRVERSPFGMFMMINGEALGTSDSQIDEASASYLDYFVKTLRSQKLEFSFLAPERLRVQLP